MELVGEQGIVVLGENLAYVRISLYGISKFVEQPTHEAVFHTLHAYSSKSVKYLSKHSTFILMSAVK